MAQFKQTSSAKKGGLFVGKSHAEGGIPAIVTDTGQPIEVEGGEAIINKKATALHWEELSKINQSAGGGVPIPPPDDADKVLEKFEQGGKITVKEKKLVFDKWRKLVNMTYTELSRYYHSKDGQTSGLTESEAKSQGISFGRESAEWILKMKKTNWRKWSDDMWKWANKQISFISRMSGMQGDLTDEKGKKTPKYKALLIWGNDPKKKNAHKFATGGSIQKESCIDFIKNSEAIKNNGYYFEFKNLLLSLGAYNIEVPKIDSLVLITYNSGGQENLTAIDTINSVELANNLAKLLEVDIALARIIVYDQTVKSKRFHTNLLNSINNKNIVIVDRDTIVCTNIDSDISFKTGGSTSTAEAIKGLKAMLQFSDDDEKAEIFAKINTLEKEKDFASGGHIATKTDNNKVRTTRLRFHLGKGENFMNWQVSHTDNKIVNYYIPYNVQIEMFNCKLVNSQTTAKKIFSGEINKTPISYVQCEKLKIINEIIKPVDPKTRLTYNPKTAPNWFDTDGKNVDNFVFEKLITFGRGVYYEAPDGKLFSLGGFLDDESEKKTFAYGGRVNPSRILIPTVRGGWTKEKIINYLKTKGSDTISTYTLSKYISEFDNWQQLKEHIFYHGTTNFIESGLKPSITLTERQAESYGGGGYGQRYFGISLTKRKRTAESFSGQKSSVTIYPVILKRDAKVIERTDFEDASDVDDIVVELYEKGIDAVWIGGGEEELTVVNPFSIILYKDGSEYFQAYGGFKSTPLTDEQIKDLYENSKVIWEKYSELYSKAETKDERNEILSSIPKFKFDDGGTVETPKLSKESLEVIDNNYNHVFGFYDFDYNKESERENYFEWLQNYYNQQFTKNLDLAITKIKSDIELIKKRKIVKLKLEAFEQLIIPSLGNEVLMPKLSVYEKLVLMNPSATIESIEKGFKEAKNIIDEDGSINQLKITQSNIFEDDYINLPNFERFVKANPEYKNVFNDWKKLFDEDIELSVKNTYAFRYPSLEQLEKLYSELLSLQNEEESQIQFKDGGKLIKRADGSYSQRGLWDNIRDNAGSGKEPTKEMLEQEAKIKQKFHLGGDMSKHLAPNGQPSKLTHEQWHLVRTPEFKAWFGDWENSPESASKVVDENGEPLVVYHGGKLFNVFNKGVGQDKGIYFTDNKYFAQDIFALEVEVYERDKRNFEYDDVPEEMLKSNQWDEKYFKYSKIYKVFLNVRKPKTYDSLDAKVIPKTYSDNIDGVIVNSTGDFGYKGNQIVVFQPNQIKLADGTNTTFDENNIDIRFEDGGVPEYHLGGDMSKHLAPNGQPSKLTHEQWHLVRTPEFKAWFGDWENDPENSSKVVDSNGEPMVVWHTTSNEFNVFSKIKSRDGFFFAPQKDRLNVYGKSKLNSYFLNLRNPSHEMFKRDLKYLKPKGYDGVMDYGHAKHLGNESLYEIIAFNPNQIKLADGTNTTFDENNPDIRFELGGIFHGSPYQFDKFTTSKMGSGIGQQEDGWGLYLTDDKEGAKNYGKYIYETTLFKNKTPNEYNFLELKKPVPKKLVDKIVEAIQKKSVTNYSVSELISFDYSGYLFYKTLSRMLGGDKNASLFLLDNGVDGLKSSFFNGKGVTYRNDYVIFDENAITIENTEYLPNNYYEDGGAVKSTSPDLYENKLLQIRVIGSENNYYKRVNQEWNFLTPDEIEKLKNGTKHELEHTATIEAIKRRDIPNEIVATFIAYDHINEDPNYYQKLDKAIPEKMARGKVIDIPVVFKQTMGDYKIYIEEVKDQNKQVFYSGEVYLKNMLLKIFPAVNSDIEELKKIMRKYIDQIKISADENTRETIFIDGKAMKVSKEIYNYVLSKSLKQKAKTYTYALTIRPFDIGTYPKQNFIRFVEEEPDYKYGLLAYSEPLDDTAIQHYSLAPVSEILQFDGITLDYYEGNFAKVKIERDSYNIPTLIVDFYDKESNEKTHSLELTGKQFREKINSGDWKVINNPNQAKMIDKKESLRYFVENQQSAGMLSSGTDLKKYDDIDILRSIMLQIIRDEEGVRNEYTIPYSVEELNSVKDQALIEFKKRPTIEPKTIIETKPESIAEIPAEPIIEENKETKMEEKNQEIVGAVSKWNEVPVRWRNVKATRPITFNLNPYDKNLNTIVKNFLGKDSLRPVMTVMHFADSGVVCTDAHKLLHIHYKNSDFKGNYATENTLKAYKYYKDEVKTIADADLKVKNDKFPNWEAVIPKESNFVYQIDTMKLYQYLQVAINYANPVTNQVVFKFDKNKQIGFNGKFMIQCLEAMMKMQNCPKLYLHLTEPSRSMLISYEKSITPTGNTYCLSMPVILRNSANIQLYGSADIDNNKYLTCYFDFEDNQIHNGDGSIADYQESYGDANAMPLALITMMDRAIKIAKPKLQILENVCVDGNGIRVYNFNSFIEIANDWGLENGLYYVKNNALVKNTFGSIDDYPKLENRVSTSNPKFTIDSDVFKFYLEKASQNTGNDDLRPVMKSIFFQYDRMPSLDIVATDAITLFRGSLTKYAKNLPDEKFDFMMGEVKQLMNFVKNIDSKEISISVEDKRYRIDAGRLHFEAKLEDGKFPNWQSVVPNSFNKELIFDVKDLYVCMNNEASKMFAKETQLKADEINIFNQNNKVYISNQPNEAKDIKQVSTEICELKIENKIFDESKMFSSSENFILLMPNSSTNGNYFNFKMSALNKVISTIGKEKVIVPYSDLNRAYIFTSDNLNYKTSDVYKPAKITAPTPAVKTPRKSENIAKPKLKGIPAKFKVGDYVLVNYGEEYGKSGFITKVMSYEQYPKSFKPDDSPMYEITGTSKNIPEDNIEISVKPTVTKETPKFTPEVIKIMPKHQLSVLRANDFSEMETAINVLNMAVARVPKLYGQDGIKDKVIYLHYFYGNQDWYVAEMDKSTGECFGYADLGYGAELGYMSIPEFVNNGKVELDFYFEPKTWSKINKGKDSAFEKQTKAVKTPAKATEKVMGTEYTVGTKAHAKAVAQKKQFDDLQKSESGTKDDTQDIKNAIKGLEAFLFSFGATKTKANLKESLDVQSAIKGLKALLK